MSGDEKLNGYRYDPRLDPEVAPLLRPAPSEASAVAAEEMVDRMLAVFPGADGIDGLRGRLVVIAREYALGVPVVRGAD